MFSNATGTQSGTVTNDTNGNATDLQLALTVIQSTILTVGLAGNLTSMACLCWSHRTRSRLSRMSLFVLHLCIADLSVSVFNVTPNLCMVVSYPNLCPFQVNNISCKIVQYLSVTSIYGSTYVSVMTALDRYFAICHPLLAQRLTNKHVHLMSFLAWILSMGFSVPQLVIFYFDSDNSVCASKWSNYPKVHNKYENMYMIWFASAVWIIPCIIITICYVSIICAIWNRPVSNKRNVSNGKSAKSDRPSVLMKPLLVTFAVTVGYILCWSPWMMSMLILQFNDRVAENMTKTGQIIIELMTYLAGFNSCLNPCIYLCFNYRSFMARPRKRTFTASSVVMHTVTDASTRFHRKQTDEDVISPYLKDNRKPAELSNANDKTNEELIKKSS